MAIIEIDRHILAQIIMIQEKVKLLQVEHKKQWAVIQQVKERTYTLLFVSPDGCNVKTPECQKRMECLLKEGRRILKATLKAESVCNEIIRMEAKQEALMTHLVSTIREADTKKGLEATENGSSKINP